MPKHNPSLKSPASSSATPVVHDEAEYSQTYIITFQRFFAYQPSTHTTSGPSSWATYLTIRVKSQTKTLTAVKSFRLTQGSSVLRSACQRETDAFRAVPLRPSKIGFLLSSNCLSQPRSLLAWGTLVSISLSSSGRGLLLRHTRSPCLTAVMPVDVLK